eukprot:jgi/Tetstr1/448885/TSEL_036111.t1
MVVLMAHPKFELYLDRHGKFIRVIAMWTIDGIAKEHWPRFGAAISRAGQEWLRVFNRVASRPQDVTPTMHNAVAHYGNLVAELGLMLGHYIEGMEHKHKPIKRDGTEGAHQLPRLQLRVRQPLHTSIMKCARRLLSRHCGVETRVPGGQSNKRNKPNTFLATAKRLNGAGPDD